MNASSANGYHNTCKLRTETSISTWSGSMASSSRRAQPRRKKPDSNDSGLNRPADPVSSPATERPAVAKPERAAAPANNSRGTTDELLDDGAWRQIEQLPEVGRAHPVGRRPTDDRMVLEAVLWVMWHQARWQDLPGGYPSPRTCQRRLRRWQEGETWNAIWRTYIERLDDQALRQWGGLFMKVILSDTGSDDVEPDERRIGRPPFWWSMARDFWRWTWDRQSEADRRRLAGHIQPDA